MKITLKVYATLTDYLPDHARRTNTLELDVPDDASIASLVAPLHLPPKLVHLVLVNGVYIAPAARAASLSSGSCRFFFANADCTPDVTLPSTQSAT